MLMLKLALKNLMSAGLRTWLSVSVLALSYILIIFYNGLIEGWNQQARNDSINWEFGHGQLWHQEYDPYDPFTLRDAHGKIPEYGKNNLTPILVRPASIYPQGRMQSITLKGIPANQTLLEIPTQQLSSNSEGVVKAIIGNRMAKAASLKEGDQILTRWRDKNGTFDALQIEIAGIFQTDVPSVDNGNIWMDIDQLYELTQLQNEATYLVANADFNPKEIAGWEFHSQGQLLEDIDNLIATEKASGVIIYGLLLGLALLAIFDTQVLSIFRRQKEIGTFIALGMTRRDVVKMFTIEGTTNSLLGAAMGAVLGTPLFIYLSKNGITMPEYTQSMNVTISQTIFPTFGIGLILTTLTIIVGATMIVSYWPARKIAQMDPTLALKGKIQ
tara:strand:+ start:221 stop:1378 length:1158 start_codon:yes stop_codon:yes gene_type:complete